MPSWLETFDVGDISTFPGAWALPARILHREVLTAYAVGGIRLHHFPAYSVSQHLLAGSFPYLHHVVDSAAQLDRRERRSGLVAEKIRDSGCDKPGAAIYHSGSDTYSVERIRRRGAACTQRDFSIDGRRHAVPLGLSGAETVGPRQIRFLSAARPGGLSDVFLRRWNPADGLVYALVVVRVGGTIPAVADLRFRCHPVCLHARLHLRGGFGGLFAARWSSRRGDARRVSALLQVGSFGTRDGPDRSCGRGHALLRRHRTAGERRSGDGVRRSGRCPVRSVAGVWLDRPDRGCHRTPMETAAAEAGVRLWRRRNGRRGAVVCPHLDSFRQSVLQLEIRQFCGEPDS